MRGRIISAPKTSGTRPMTDKVRAALFNILGDIEGLTVLDAYAGSGALGFEALSRGAANAEAIELGSEALRSIAANIERLGLGAEYKVHPQKVESWLAGGSGKMYDLIFAMPPYAVLDKAVLQQLADHLEPGGLLIVEFPRQQTDYSLGGLEVVKTKSYGDPSLVFYRK